ncbi:MAG: hypothetical protein Ct9H90mP20_0970 [Candidatus Neomarinimicrobiota bacterium]|nr:MAG: hypothetical protein Ct9H90mP20_0970 [Candidatus Neomarinimicrobiota bacterium]
MIYPLGAKSFSQTLKMGSEIFCQLKFLLEEKGFSTAVGDEGGFAPNLRSNQEAIEIILEAIERSPYSAGEEIFLSLDVAASELFDNEKYHINLKIKSYLAIR